MTVDRPGARAEIPAGRWLSRRATRVSFDAQQGVFLIDTRPAGPRESFTALSARWNADPEAAEATHRRKWGPAEYEPLGRRNLPNALARIVAADAARDRRQAETIARREAERFLRRYGPLGFARLPGADPAWRGEPLGWIMAEARTVRFALELIEALRDRQARELLRVLHHQRPAANRSSPASGGGDWRYVRYELCREAFHHGSAQRYDLSQPPQRRPWLDLATGWYDPSASYPLSAAAYLALMHYPDPRPLTEAEIGRLCDHAGSIVSDLVGLHTEGMVGRFGWRAGHFCAWPEGGPLLRAIWILIAEAASAGWQIRRCGECQTPFVVTHARQQYCPAGAGSQKSACLAKRQMRLQRQGQRAGRATSPGQA